MLVRTVLSIFFFTSFIGKLIHPDEALQVLRTTWELSSAHSRLTFVALIIFEAGVFLYVTVRGDRWALLACSVLVLLLSASPALQLLRGSEAGCGCGVPLKISPAAAQQFALARNAFIILIAGVGVRQLSSLPRMSQRSGIKSHSSHQIVHQP